MLCCIVFSYHQLQPGCCCLNRIRYNTPTAQACRSLLGARDWIWRFFVTSLVARANNIPNLECKALPLLPRKRPQRQVSSKHSMLMSVGYGGPASGQTEKLWSATNQTQTWGQGGPFVCFLELRLSPKAWPSCCSTDEQCSEISTARSRVPGALHPEQDLEPLLSPTPYPPEPEQPPSPSLSPPPQATLPLLRHCRTRHPLPSLCHCRHRRLHQPPPLLPPLSDVLDGICHDSDDCNGFMMRISNEGPAEGIVSNGKNISAKMMMSAKMKVYET